MAANRIHYEHFKLQQEAERQVVRDLPEKLCGGDSPVTESEYYARLHSMLNVMRMSVAKHTQAAHLFKDACTDLALTIENNGKRYFERCVSPLQAHEPHNHVECVAVGHLASHLIQAGPEFCSTGDVKQLDDELESALTNHALYHDPTMTGKGFESECGMVDAAQIELARHKIEAAIEATHAPGRTQEFDASSLISHFAYDAKLILSVGKLVATGKADLLGSALPGCLENPQSVQPNAFVQRRLNDGRLFSTSELLSELQSRQPCAANTDGCHWLASLVFSNFYYRMSPMKDIGYVVDVSPSADLKRCNGEPCRRASRAVDQYARVTANLTQIRNKIVSSFGYAVGEYSEQASTDEAFIEQILMTLDGTDEALQKLQTSSAELDVSTIKDRSLICLGESQCPDWPRGAVAPLHADRLTVAKGECFNEQIVWY